MKKIDKIPNLTTRTNRGRPMLVPEQVQVVADTVNQIIDNLNELIPNKDLSVLGAKILDKYRKDKKITLLGVHDELCEIDVAKLVDQFTDGLLYDLGHEYAYIVTRDAEDPARLVQDLAVYCVISYLMSQVKPSKKSDALRVCLFSAAKDLASNQASISRAKIAAEKLNDQFRTDEDVVEQVYHSAVEFCDEGNNVSVWLTCHHGLQQLAKDIMDWRCYYRYTKELSDEPKLITDRLPEESLNRGISIGVLAFGSSGVTPAQYDFNKNQWIIYHGTGIIRTNEVFGWILNPYKDDKTYPFPNWSKLNTLKNG